MRERLCASLKAEIEGDVCDSHAHARSGVCDDSKRLSQRQHRHATVHYATPVGHEQRWRARQSAACERVYKRGSSPLPVSPMAQPCVPPPQILRYHPRFSSSWTRGLAPGEQLVDAGSVRSNPRVPSHHTSVGVLVPTPPDLGWRATAGEGVAGSCCVLNWYAHGAPCPQGQVSACWKQAHDHAGHPSMARRCATANGRIQVTYAVRARSAGTIS